MPHNHNDVLTKYVQTFIETLLQNGVEDVVISPGSRSTPMALVFAQYPSLNLYINVDERSAGFFALGIAKAKKKPAVLLCTSGTAAANYYPAIVEARYARVPLIVLTADRPHELREVGAPQAIHQVDMYGKHVKLSIDMAVPDSSEALLHYTKGAAARGYATALKAPSGPVHFNFPFREPLVPNKISPNETKKGTKNVLLGDGRTLSPNAKDELIGLLTLKEKGIIVCGPNISERDIPYLLHFADQWGFPILADPLSQFRCGEHAKDLIIDEYDAFLRIPELRPVLQPDLVIRFGAMPVSKALTTFISSNEVDYVVIEPGEEWQDPTGRVNHMVYTSDQEFSRSILPSIKREKQWTSTWRQYNDNSKTSIDAFYDNIEWEEGKVVKTLLDVIPTDATLFVSNSMPIRDVDTFLSKTDKSLKVLANRGANGIDGVVSSALGVSTVYQRTYLLIGDLAFFHDLNGLLAAKSYDLNITIIVLNNNGGGIFSYLPQSSEEEYFEKLFGTPTDLDFSHIAALYKGHYELIDNIRDLSQCIQANNEKQGLSIIEVKTNRAVNTETHRKMWNFVSQEIKKQL